MDLRLFVNTKEIPYLKAALKEACEKHASKAGAGIIKGLYERVLICEQLQENLNKTKILDT